MDNYVIKIEKNVPYQERYSAGSWPFGEMKIGDSFIIPETLLPKVTTAMSLFGKRHKMKFSKRGNRVWRVK